MQYETDPKNIPLLVRDLPKTGDQTIATHKECLTLIASARIKPNQVVGRVTSISKDGFEFEPNKG